MVPRCFGICRYNGARALILEHLGGVSLASPEGATLKLEELSDLLQVCYRALHPFGMHYDDPYPGNFQLLDDKIMMLDLEQVEFDLSAEDQAYVMATNIGDLASRYRTMQASFRLNSLLEPA